MLFIPLISFSVVLNGLLARTTSLISLVDISVGTVVWDEGVGVDISRRFIDSFEVRGTGFSKLSG